MLKVTKKISADIGENLCPDLLLQKTERADSAIVADPAFVAVVTTAE
jgi:hypothetical protein